ncbi:LysR substrate-binding domain-containing protein [Peribacillus sp. NPDC096622]|uniref:LysR substrate-binding domain-containing protein n=1 Tax=Peribacillus sp. NPDC096622 TaxID=3364396 RepID=UPI00382297B4
MKECKKEKDFEKVASSVFGFLNTSGRLWISKLFNERVRSYCKVSQFFKLYPFEDLGQFNMLVFGDGCHYRDALESWMEEEGIYPKRTLKFGTIEAIIGCIKAGMGIAVMVQSVLKDHQQSLHVTPLPEKYAKVPTHFIMRKDVMLSAD